MKTKRFAIIAWDLLSTAAQVKRVNKQTESLWKNEGIFSTFSFAVRSTRTKSKEARNCVRTKEAADRGTISDKSSRTLWPSCVWCRLKMWSFHFSVTSNFTNAKHRIGSSESQSVQCDYWPWTRYKDVDKMNDGSVQNQTPARHLEQIDRARTNKSDR